MFNAKALILQPPQNTPVLHLTFEICCCITQTTGCVRGHWAERLFHVMLLTRAITLEPRLGVCPWHWNGSNANTRG